MTQPPQALSLSQLHYQIQDALAMEFGGLGTWVVAEIARVNEKNGHRYFELVESSDRTILAKAQANLWKGNYIRLHQQHGYEVQQLLTAGTEVMLMVQVGFHPVYGLKLNIVDISMDFAYGQLEKLKKATLERLEKEGILYENKALALPSVIQNLAVVGAPDSAGMADFMDQLSNNEYGYTFNILPFESSVQGEHAVNELSNAIGKAQAAEIDAICVVRGGGARLDLEVFNHYELARIIALCEVPVLVGIGHETDSSVVDVVANTSVKTPTACAQHIVNHNAEFEYLIASMARKMSRLSQLHISETLRATDLAVRQLSSHSQRMIVQQDRRLTTSSSTLNKCVRGMIHQPLADLDHLRLKLGQYGAQKVIADFKLDLERQKQQLAFGVSKVLETQLRKLDSFAAVVNNQDPAIRLKTGYGINRINGNLIADISKVKQGDELCTEIKDGEIISTVNQIKHG